MLVERLEDRLLFADSLNLSLKFVDKERTSNLIRFLKLREDFIFYDLEGVDCRGGYHRNLKIVGSKYVSMARSVFANWIEPRLHRSPVRKLNWGWSDK